MTCPTAIDAAVPLAPNVGATITFIVRADTVPITVAAATDDVLRLTSSGVDWIMKKARAMADTRAIPVVGTARSQASPAARWMKNPPHPRESTRVLRHG